MLLQRLIEYSDRLDLPPMLYSEVPIRYIIELDPSGRCLGITDTADPASPRTRRGQRRLAPQVQRSSRIRPLLLADKADYVLGYSGGQRSSQRAEACHRAFIELADQCAAETEEAAVLAVQRFLHNAPLEQLTLDEAFDPQATITFRVGEVFPVDLPSVQGFWALENNPESSTATVMQCVACGRQRPVLSRLQGKIKGVPGGQTSGTSIISANAEAFESYGLQASLVAPTCADCGERFTKAANDLLSREANRVIMGGAAFIYWTKEQLGEDIFAAFNKPEPGQVRALIVSARRGDWLPGVDDTAFYATSLSGSGGRTVVRDWLDTTVGQVKRHLAAWFQGQAIVGPAGEDANGRPYGISALAFATVREPKDLPVTTPRTLLRAAFTGTPLPWDILYQVVRRIKTQHEERGDPLQRKVKQVQAALIKLVLLGQEIDAIEEDYMTQLNPGHPDPAYHCGRLLAVLETAQRLAIRRVNATIVDRFYGTASTAPASVFPRLVRGSQPHLAKLLRDRPPAHHALQRRLEEILDQMPEYPKVLSLQRQGLFSLGYYHQRAYDRAQARKAVERRDQNPPPQLGQDMPADAFDHDSQDPNQTQQEE